MVDIKGQTCIITVASSGIGRASAYALAASLRSPAIQPGINHPEKNPTRTSFRETAIFQRDTKFRYC